MTLGQLKTFLAVVRQGSIRGASAELSVTEPSVSVGVKALEHEVGVPLTERRGRGIWITPAGREFATYASMILEIYETAARRVRETGARAPLLTLSAVITAAEYLLAPILRLFKDLCPQVELRMEVGNMASVIEDLISHRMQLGIGGRPPEHSSGIVGEPFLANHLIVVAAPEHRLACEPELDPIRLADETWLVRESGSGTRSNTQELFSKAGFNDPATMTLGSNGAVKQAAAAGLGVTLISAHAVAGELAAGALVQLGVKGTPVVRAWHVLYSAGEKPTEAANTFIKLLRSSAARREIDAWYGESVAFLPTVAQGRPVPTGVERRSTAG